MVIRNKATRDYTVVKNAIINHEWLQPLAKLAIIYILSKPDDWHVRITDLRNYLDVGRDKMRDIMRNIEDCQYARLVSTRDADGNFTGREYYFYDQPHENGTPENQSFHGTPEKPTVGKTDGRENRGCIPSTENIPSTESRKNTESDLVKIIGKQQAKALGKSKASSLPAEKKRILLDFLVYRKDNGKPYKSLHALVNKFHDNDASILRAAVELTMVNGWQGVFLDKVKNKQDVQVSRPHATPPAPALPAVDREATKARLAEMQAAGKWGNF